MSVSFRGAAWLQGSHQPFDRLDHPSWIDDGGCYAVAGDEKKRLTESEAHLQKVIYEAGLVVGAEA